MNNEKDDLEKLIVMAEKVSETAHGLRLKMANARVKAQIFIMVSVISACGLALLYMNIIFTSSSDPERSLLYALAALALLLAISSFYLAYLQERRMRDHRRELYSEDKVLKELLDMVFEYQQLISTTDLSFVDKAILDLRLKRIKFSTEWNSRSPPKGLE